MKTAGLSPRMLAFRVGVSGKTVERWIADEELIPHARNREDASNALGVEAEMLWPKAVKERLRGGGGQEVVESYAFRSACPSGIWADLISDASDELFFGGYTSYFLWTQIPAFPETLRRKAEGGCRVRFLLGDPDGDVTRQREQIEDVRLTVSTRINTTLEQVARLGRVDGLEARFSAPTDAMNHVSLSVFRFDDEALVTPHLATAVGHDSPLMRLRRRSDQGVFSRFVAHCDELWERATPVPEG
ncbi:XRE family transcriptional regulator [Streptomyces sp. NPDC001339]|uniref:XRE family transcriptional regulator n=1 Tax=Streptomyces sp. NPDC001339 TaxID=3364563 RepID=UPI00369F282D